MIQDSAFISLQTVCHSDQTEFHKQDTSGDGSLGSFEHSNCKIDESTSQLPPGNE